MWTCVNAVLCIQTEESHEYLDSRINVVRGLDKIVDSPPNRYIECGVSYRYFGN